jgi:hypothetical protein
MSLRNASQALWQSNFINNLLDCFAHYIPPHALLGASAHRKDITTQSRMPDAPVTSMNSIMRPLIL